MNLNQIFELESYNEAYIFANENGYVIKELQGVSPRQFQIVEPKPLEPQQVLDLLRAQREVECFEKLVKSPYWYANLTELQNIELKQWYHDWLDVTKTKIVPTKPSWL